VTTPVLTQTLSLTLGALIGADREGGVARSKKYDGESTPI
jgi:hypothetical protein